MTKVQKEIIEKMENGWELLTDGKPRLVKNMGGMGGFVRDIQQRTLNSLVKKGLIEIQTNNHIGRLIN